MMARETTTQSNESIGTRPRLEVSKSYHAYVHGMDAEVRLKLTLVVCIPVI
jgi:hypothetical protein